MSGHNDGENFADDGMASRYVRPFITYNNMVLSDHIDDDDTGYDYKFTEIYSFSDYNLKSSVFSDETKDFNGKFDLDIMFSKYDESYMQSMVCSRVYQRDDGTLIYADFLLKKADSGWKIANYSIMDENEKMLAESIKETEVQPTTAESDDDAEFGELQLHEAKIFSNVEEAEAFNKKIDEEMADGAFRFKKVNTEKYAQQIWKAE